MSIRSTDRLDERKLMAMIKAGDVAAFEVFYDRYCASARRVALSICREEGAADEVVQNAFMSIWKNRAAYREGRDSLVAWLLTAVRHRSIDMIRANGARARGLARAGALESRSLDGDLADLAVKRDAADRIRTLLGMLPDNQQEVITLAFYGGLSHSQIAAHLNVPIGTVKSRMRLGLHKLRPEVARIVGRAEQSQMQHATVLSQSQSQPESGGGLLT